MIYENYFSLQQRPFSIAPNPEFLFAQGQYQEAIAVLEYGMVHRGGFTLLTGEVGTGKTTLCKHLLHLVPPSTEVALILHPQLDRIELLQLICREFYLDIRWEAKEIELIEALTEFLLSVYAKGGYSLLVIDEAQLLDTSVLELIRLLTNLETHTDKLLQIILLGQPELKQRLEQYNLRQLNQRFTTRFHLSPLSFKEVRQYVQHRVGVAGSSKSLFSYGSSWAIYRLTGGIPRLINLLADRSLMGAYAERRKKVGMSVVYKAAKEVLPEVKRVRPVWLAPALVLMLALVLFQFYPSNQKSSQPLFETILESASDSIVKIQQSSQGILENCRQQKDCWQGKLPQELISYSFSRVQVYQKGQWQDWPGTDNGNPLVLTRIEWQSPFDMDGSIREGDVHPFVPWVRDVLKQNNSFEVRTDDYQNWQVIKPNGSQSSPAISPEYYDALLMESVKRFQQENNLLVDGVLGKQTLISLTLLNNKHQGVN